MATPASKTQTIFQDVLANYLISMARTVEGSAGCALDALLRPNLEAAAELSSKVFLVEPRVSEMEILIDDHAVRMLRTGLLDDEEIRRVVASQFVLATRYLERIADHSTNIAEDIIFWVRGLDVRHGRTRMVIEEANYPEKRN
jgi:phosphate transport system protein